VSLGPQRERRVNGGTAALEVGDQRVTKSGTAFLAGIWTTRNRGATKQIDALVLCRELGEGTFGKGRGPIATGRSDSRRDL